MTKFTSRICLGCISGIYSGLIITAILAMFFLGSNFSVKQILTTYGVAMILGVLTGGLVCGFNYYRRSKSDLTQCKISDGVNAREFAVIFGLMLLGVATLGYLQFY